MLIEFIRLKWNIFKLERRLNRLRDGRKQGFFLTKGQYEFFIGALTVSVVYLFLRHFNKITRIAVSLFVIKAENYFLEVGELFFKTVQKKVATNKREG